MKYYDHKKSKKKLIASIIIIVIVVLLFAVCVAGLGARYWYGKQLQPKSVKSASVVVVIPTGYSAKQIGQLLQAKGLIRNATAFEAYVRLHNLRANLKAGQYQLDASWSTEDIIYIISEGKIKTALFTIKPGQRLDQIKQSLIKYGFSDTEVDAALNPNNYKNYSVLVNKPIDASLEGYLYPESFQTTNSSKVSDIIGQSLTEMSQVLTSYITNVFKQNGLNIHQAITLASIVEKEVSDPSDKKTVAGVFLNRLKANMPLGSDVTYHYAAIITNQEPSPDINSLYNTRKYGGLPPGPISNVSKQSLLAVAYPAKSDYLFFVTGDDGKTYFSKTIQEHEALAKQYCHKLCSTY